MRHNIGNKVYQVKGNDDIPNWMIELENKGYIFNPQDDGILMIIPGEEYKFTALIPIGDCIVHSVNNLVYTCTKEHVDMEGWKF